MFSGSSINSHYKYEIIDKGQKIWIKSVLWEYSCVEEHFIKSYKGYFFKYSLLQAVLPRNRLDPKLIHFKGHFYNIISFFNISWVPSPPLPKKAYDNLKVRIDSWNHLRDRSRSKFFLGPLFIPKFLNSYVLLNLNMVCMFVLFRVLVQKYMHIIYTRIYTVCFCTTKKLYICVYLDVLCLLNCVFFPWRFKRDIQKYLFCFF